MCCGRSSKSKSVRRGGLSLKRNLVRPNPSLEQIQEQSKEMIQSVEPKVEEPKPEEENQVPND